MFPYISQIYRGPEESIYHHLLSTLTCNSQYRKLSLKEISMAIRLPKRDFENLSRHDSPHDDNSSDNVDFF
jgi:hypothetical protein